MMISNPFSHVLLLSTAFGGSYMVIKAIGVWVGNYPNEFALAEQLKNDKNFKVKFYRKQTIF